MKLKTLKPTLRTVAPALRIVGSNSWRAGKTANERGYTYRWQQARERFLFKHPLCTMCEAAGRVEVATVVDHKVPHRGDQELFWNRDNWQPLCKTCHDSAKQREERGAATPYGHGAGG